MSDEGAVSLLRSEKNKGLGGYKHIAPNGAENQGRLHSPNKDTFWMVLGEDLRKRNDPSEIPRWNSQHEALLVQIPLALASRVINVHDL